MFLPFGKVRMGYPTGEVRWGLMFSCRVTCSFPLGRSGWVILWEGQDGLSFGKVRMGLKVRMGYPLGRLGWVILLEEKSFDFYLQQSDESRIFALHKICNIKYVMTVRHYGTTE